jgi:predicted RNase H-like nuclease (RuvC/YqgF family)
MLFPWFRYRKEIKEIEKEIDQLKLDSQGLVNQNPEIVKKIEKLEAEKAVLKRLNSGELHF